MFHYRFADIGLLLSVALTVEPSGCILCRLICTVGSLLWQRSWALLNMARMMSWAYISFWTSFISPDCKEWKKKISVVININFNQQGNLRCHSLGTWRDAIIWIRRGGKKQRMTQWNLLRLSRWAVFPFPLHSTEVSVTSTSGSQSVAHSLYKVGSRPLMCIDTLKCHQTYITSARVWQTWSPIHKYNMNPPSSSLSEHRIPSNCK